MRERPGSRERAGLRERMGEALFLRVAGPDGARHRDRIHGTPGPRWFAPGSPITVVQADASMYVGGIRAVLLQTMQPQAMTAVAEHSGYRGDMWGRLARTSRYLAVTTFGTAEHAQQAVDAVRAIHDRVNGAMPDGSSYDANDPHLLECVHVAEIQSFLLAHRRYGARRLDQAGYDEYVAQAAFVARKLGAVDPPETEAELQAAVHLDVRAVRDGARPDRHVLVERLVGRRAPRREVRHGGAAVAGHRARVIVLHFMIVPGHEPRARCVHRLQLGFPAMQGVALAIVVQRQHPAARGNPDRLGRIRILVDVVAQEQHRVQVLFAHMAPGSEVAVVPTLARRVGEAQLLRPRIGRRKSARATRRAYRVSQHEAIEVPAIGLQARHFDVNRVCEFGRRLRLAALRDAGKLLVVRHLPAHRHGILAQALQSTGRDQSRPQHDRVMSG